MNEFQNIVLAPGERWWSPSFPLEVLKSFGGKPLWKVDEQTHTVYGLSTAEVPDSDNEEADYVDSKANYLSWGDATSAITRAAGQAVSFGNIRQQHTTAIGGKVNRIDCIDDKRQIWLLTQPVDDQVWDKLAGGFFTGYSHAGRYQYRRCKVCNYDLPAGNYCPQCRKENIVRYAPVLSEVSYVDRPCLGIATFAYVKADGRMEMRKFVAPAAKKVLVDMRELAEMARSSFMQAIDDLEKRARSPIGQFANNGKGPGHDAAVGAGFEHKRTGTVVEGSAEPVSACNYEHANGARLTLCEDGRWTHADGKGRTTTGTGVEALTSHLAAQAPKKADGVSTQSGFNAYQQVGVKPTHCEHCDRDVDPPTGSDAMKCPHCGKDIKTASAAEKVEDTNDMKDEAVQELVKTAVAEALKAQEKPAVTPAPPSEKAVELRARMADVTKQLSDAIATRIEAVRKDMSQVGRLADILQGIRWLQQSSFWEGQIEQDDRDFAIADRMGAWLQEGVNILNAVVSDETSELTTDLATPALKAAIQSEGEDVMKIEELLLKAAKGIFGKAAGAHEAMGASHAKMADCHKAAADAHKCMFGKAKKAADSDDDDKAEKACHKAEFDHHTAKSAHHEKMAKAHGALADAFKAAADDASQKADEPVDLNKALGDSQEALVTKITEQFGPVLKALASLEKLESMEKSLDETVKAVATLQADVTKFGNEVVPTLAKGALAPQLIDRKTSEPVKQPAQPANLESNPYENMI